MHSIDSSNDTSSNTTTSNNSTTNNNSATSSSQSTTSTVFVNSSSVPLAPIIGGVIGGVGGIAVCLVVSFCLCRRRLQRFTGRSYNTDKSDTIEPYETQNISVDPLVGESIWIQNSRSPRSIRPGVETLAAARDEHNTFENDALLATASESPTLSALLRGAITKKRAVVNRNELVRQMEEMQRLMVSLQTQLPASRGEEPSILENDQRVENLQRRIMMLQSDLERLQASQVEMMRGWNDAGSLPEYDESA